MKKGLSQEVIDRVESIEGMNFVDATKRRYLVDKMSFRKLALRWGCNERTVHKILVTASVDIRHGGEAVATQWVDASGRRFSTGKRLADINHKMALEGTHVRQGKTKENSQLIRSIAEKLKTSTSFRRAETMQKAIAASKKTRSEHPERMSALAKPMSKCEKMVFEFLATLPYRVEVNKLFGRFVVDFYIPDLGMVVDCQGRNRFPLSYERHCTIAEKCPRIVYCVNEQIKRAGLGRLNDYITSVQRAGVNPTFGSAETMIFGACGNSPFGADTYKFVIHRMGVHADYFSNLTATPED